MESRRITLGLPWGQVSALAWTPRTRSGVDVLLLHGGGVDNAQLSWGGIGAALAQAGHRVVAPDHPGFGHSVVAPWRLTQERLVEYVGEVVDALGLEEYAVGGLSMGGGMALGHLLDRPAGVRAAVLFGTYGVMRRQFSGPFALPLHATTALLVASGWLDLMGMITAQQRAWMSWSLDQIILNPASKSRELLDDVMEEARRRGSFEAFGQWQRDEYGWVRLKTDYSERLGEITAPVLLVHGEADTGVPVERAVAAADRLPDSRLLVIPDGGHWIQRDRPDEVVPAVLDFLSSRT